ncbi:Sec7 domain-containing protein, partial [Pavlovales sp. CCMP2436]
KKKKKKKKNDKYKGLEHLKKTGHIVWTTEGIAAFFKRTPGLDKTQVGDYMGDHNEWNKGVLYAFVDSFDFAGLHFDDGIRRFMDGFRLPGEAQKIDRMMEKFAARYCECNPNTFQSADTGTYMSAEEFLRNNRGINGADDLSAEFMGNLYTRILNNEIKMKDDGGAEAAAGSGVGGRRRKEALYAVEVAKSVQKSQEAFKAKAGKRSTYVSTSHADTVVPMFSQLWGPLLAGLSVFLEEVDRSRREGGDAAEPVSGAGAEEEVRIALDGFAHALHLACSFGLRTEQGAFLAALVKFTALGTGE